MPRTHTPAAHRTLCVFCSAEFVSRNIRRTYCYEESCVKARKRQAATPGEPCSACGRPSLGKGLCPTHYSVQWRIENAERFTHTCAHCGIEFKTWRKVMAACSLLCQRRGAIKTAQPLAIAAQRKGTDLVLYVRPRTWAGTIARGKLWTYGPCRECGDTFTAPGRALYCSERCSGARSMRTRIAKYGEFTISTIDRRAIYRRDSNTCQLCMKPVDMTLDYNDRMSATLDHIEPQSLAITPNHSESNLRLAHRLCNSIRGNGVGPMTPST